MFALKIPNEREPFPGKSRKFTKELRVKPTHKSPWAKNAPMHVIQFLPVSQAEDLGALII